MKANGSGVFTLVTMIFSVFLIFVAGPVAAETDEVSIDVAAEIAEMQAQLRQMMIRINQASFDNSGYFLEAEDSSFHQQSSAQQGLESQISDTSHHADTGSREAVIKTSKSDVVEE